MFLMMAGNKKVEELSKNAELTALRLGLTEGIGWEIQHALSSLSDLRKLIFLIPDLEKNDVSSFFTKLENAIKDIRPDVQTTPCYVNKQSHCLNKREWGSVSSIIYFKKEEDGSYTMKQSIIPQQTIWNFLSGGGYGIAFKRAMFPVYEQFGKLDFVKRYYGEYWFWVKLIF